MTYAHQIAQAMAFLESKSIKHGHLAALVISLRHVIFRLEPCHSQTMRDCVQAWFDVQSWRSGTVTS
jgi:hypothetical protein